MFRALHGQHTYHYDVAAAETHLGWLHVDMGTNEALTAAEGSFRKVVDAYTRLYDTIATWRMYCMAWHVSYGRGELQLSTPAA